MNESSAQALPGTEYAIHPFFSPDGQWIGFGEPIEWPNVVRLKKFPIGGGPATTICDIAPPKGITWMADGSIVFAGIATGLQRVSSSGGTPASRSTMLGAT